MACSNAWQKSSPLDFYSKPTPHKESLMSEKNHRTIHQSYAIAAAPEKVFRALTEPDMLSRWWTTRGRSEARPGGAFEYIWEFEDSSHNGKQMGAYLDVVPGEKLSYPWEAGDNGGVPNTTVRFQLKAHEEGTQLELEHHGYGPGEDWDQEFEMTARAWGFFLGNLKSYLEEGQDQRKAVLGQVTS
jgi:uncharacterized protein YndB with AHSA1/START domain